MRPQQPDALRDIGIVCRHHAAVAEASQVLRRKKAEASDVSNRASAALLPFRADRLSCIFDDIEFVPARNFQDWRHVCHLSWKLRAGTNSMSSKMQLRRSARN